MLRAAAVAAGLGAAVAAGQGIASAAPSDSSDSGPAASAPDHADTRPNKAVRPSVRQPTARSAAAKVRAPLSTVKNRPNPLAPAKALVDSLLVAVRPSQAAPSRAAATPTTVTDETPDDTETSTADPTGLAEIRTRSGVSVQQATDGTVKVINGAFTSTTVSTAADAASVLNEVAPVLGARAGFATAGNITVQHAGQEPGDVAESFYRFRE
ncbi:MAG: hypothetical protein ABWY93_13220, partial [Mycobacterium sp.]